jgi:NACalpha-BTF3-like transcription factor|tara:strand:- start:630 stop:896 length:267 start_codon:yes stop_codon:yes gene_type:complete
METRSDFEDLNQHPILENFKQNDEEFRKERKYRSKFIHSNLSKESIDEIKKLTKETSEELINKALKITNGDMKKAMCMLFDPSIKIEI